MRECLTLLKAGGYAGWLSLEISISPALDDAVRAAGRVRAWWEQA